MAEDGDSVTVLFALLVLIPVAMIILLLIPLRYSLEILSNRPLQVKAEAKWLSKIFHARFACEEGKPTFKEVYVLGRVKVGRERDYEDWLSKRVDEAVEESSEEEVELHKEKLSENAMDDSDVNRQREGRKRWWLSYALRRDTYEAVAGFLRRIYLHSCPRQVELRGTIGLGDPYETGLLSGLLYSLWPGHMKEVSFNYLAPSFEGRWFWAGRIIPVTLLWYTLQFVRTKPVDEIVHNIIKGGK